MAFPNQANWRVKVRIGRVTYWNNEGKGYGFIRPVDGGADQFVHISALGDEPPPIQGDRVEFETEFDDRKGKEKAINVRVL